MILISKPGNKGRVVTDTLAIKTGHYWQEREDSKKAERNTNENVWSEAR